MAAALCLGVAAAAQAQGAAALRVVASTPNGPVGASVTQASIRFSEPMVALAGTEVDQVDFVTVTPAVDVAFHWPDTNVLVVTPRSGRFPFASRITIGIGAGAAAVSGRRLEAPQAFTFETPSPRLREAALVPRIDPGTKQPTGTDLRLAFDIPVRTADALTRTRIAYAPVPSPVPALSAAARSRMARLDPDGLAKRDAWARRIGAQLARRLALRATLAPGEQGASASVLLRLPETPPAGARLAIAATGVASPEGPLRRTTTDRVTAASGAPLTIAGPDCSGPCEAAFTSFTTSGRIDPAALRAAVRVTDITDAAAERPLEPGPGPAIGFSWQMHSLGALGYTLVPGHRYAARVDASLQDVEGRRLGAPWMSVFDVGLPSSFTGLGTMGPAVWEAANGPRLPVFSRSLVDVRTRVTPLGPTEAALESLSPRAPVPGSTTPVVTAVTPPIDGTEQETLVDVAGALSPRGTGIVRWSVEAGREASGRSGFDVTVTPRAFVNAAIVQVTNIGVTVRGTGDRLAILATRLDTGAPIADAEVRVVDNASGALWRGRTDADGLAVATTGSAPGPSRGVAAVIVEHDGDAAFIGASGAWYASDANSVELAGVVFTDRGVYRPGETAHVKALVQAATPRGLEPLPPGTMLTLSVERPGTDDASFEAPIGPTGGVEWTVPIPEDAKVDEPTWLNVGRTDGDRDRGDVRGELLVKAVRPVEFQATISVTAERAGGRPVLAARVEARDLSDIALSGAQVAWTVTRQRPYGLPEVLGADPDFVYEFYDAALEDRLEEHEDEMFRLERRVDLDAAGTDAARFELPEGLEGRGRFTVAAQITDTSSQAIGRKAVIDVAPEAYLGIGHDEAAWAARIPAVAVVARTASGAHVPGIPVRLRVVAAGKGETDPGAVVLGAITGSAPVRVVLPEAFRNVEVEITVRAEDPRRAVMPAEIMLNPGGGSPTPPAAAPDTLTVTLDRERYDPGDRARVTISAPAGYTSALLTLERGAVLEAHVVRLDGRRVSVDLPVGDSAVAGLQAVVTAVRGRTAPCCEPGRDDPGRPAVSVASVNVPLNRASAELAVEIDAPATRRPGEHATVTVRVRDHAGRPVPGEVTIWAVDEGLLALTHYELPNPFAAMYDRERGWVGFADTRLQLLKRALPQYWGELIQTSAGERSQTTAIGAFDTDAGDPDARRDFRPLAFWHGAVTTNADGVAAIDAVLPDTLTTYRILAVATATGARIGGARAPLTVAKPLMVRPALPRFLTRLDRAQFRVSVAAGLVHGSGTVTLESLTPDLLHVSGGPQRFDVAAGGRSLTTFRAEALGEGVARLRVVATVGSERDTFEKDLPIADATVLETSAAVGEAAPEAVEAIRLPATIDARAGHLDVELASTMLVGLAAAGDYVTSYPYTCAEQMSSRALVLVLASALGPSFTMARGPNRDAARREAAQAALERLEAYHCDGGYGYWTDCHLHSPYLSAYVLFVLETAKRHGFQVADATIERDAGDLEAALAKPPVARTGHDDLAWRAFAAKVLVDAGRTPKAAIDTLYAARETLPLFALAHLLDAAAGVDAASPRVTELRRQIRNGLTVGATAHVEEKTLAAYYWTWPSNRKSTAVVLDVLARRGGLTAEEARPMVSWMLGARQPDGIWPGTQDNVWSLIGLVAYQRAFEPRRTELTAAASLDSREVVRQALDLNQPLVSRRVPMPELTGLVAPGRTSQLTVTSSGSGPVFYTTRLAYALPARDAGALSHGITLSRQYVPVVRGKDGAPATTFAPGDLVRVILEVRVPEDRTFVAVSDPLPAGFEPVDTSLAIAAPDATEAGDDATRFYWSYEGFDRVERRDRRVDFFATRLPDGEHQISYLARATTPGTFFAAPAHAEAMYEPEVSGRGAGATITVTPSP